MIRPLPWDSQHFGIRIGRVDGETLSEAATSAFADERGSFDCVYLLADADHAETAERAHSLGFRMVDVRVTFDRPLDSSGAAMKDGVIREAADGDMPRLEALAAATHGSTRFYFDRRFDRARVDEMYRIWIRNERAKGNVFVADDGDGAVGYISCGVRGVDAEIGLVAVAEAARGSGKARALLARALGWAAANGAARISVVTQGRNVAAQRLYEGASFRCRSARVWYHAWPS